MADIRADGFRSFQMRLRGLGLPLDTCAATLAGPTVDGFRLACTNKRLQGKLVCARHHPRTAELIQTHPDEAGLEPRLGHGLLNPETGLLLEEEVFYMPRTVLVGDKIVGPLVKTQCFDYTRFDSVGRGTHRCMNEVYMGAPYCPVHALEASSMLMDLHHLAEGGPVSIGVFMVDPRAGPGGEVGTAGDVIGSLIGTDSRGPVLLAERMSRRKMDARYGKEVVAPYAYNNTFGNTAFDTLLYRALLSMANTAPPNYCNAVFTHLLHGTFGVEVRADLPETVTNGSALLIDYGPAYREGLQAGEMADVSLRPPLPAVCSQVASLYDFGGFHRAPLRAPAYAQQLTNGSGLLLPSRMYPCFPEIVAYFGQDLRSVLQSAQHRLLQLCQPWFQYRVLYWLCQRRELGTTAWISAVLQDPSRGDLFLYLLRVLAHTETRKQVLTSDGSHKNIACISLPVLAIFLACNLPQISQNKDVQLLLQAAEEHGWAAIYDGTACISPQHQRDVGVSMADYCVCAYQQLMLLTNALEIALNDENPWPRSMGFFANAFTAALVMSPYSPLKSKVLTTKHDLAGTFDVQNSPGYQMLSPHGGSDIVANMSRLLFEEWNTSMLCPQHELGSALKRARTILTDVTLATDFVYDAHTDLAHLHRMLLSNVCASMTEVLVFVMAWSPHWSASVVGATLVRGLNVSTEAPTAFDCLAEERKRVDKCLMTLKNTL